MAKFNGPSKALTEFRNCFEASMTFDEAIGCAGLSEKPEALIDVLRRAWDGWEKSFSAECAIEHALTAEMVVGWAKELQTNA